MESSPKRFFHWIQRNFNLANILTGQDSKKDSNRTKLNFRGRQKGVLFALHAVITACCCFFGLGLGKLTKLILVMFYSSDFRIMKSDFYRIGSWCEYWSIYLRYCQPIIESSLCWTRMRYSTPTNNQYSVAFNQMLEHYTHVMPPHFVLYNF